ncbi:MAG: sulfate ABC transporter substrate-binding protein [Methylococcaceae bacterium]
MNKSLLLATGLVALLSINNSHAETSLLNVSYDPTRELYQEYNKAFIKHWQETKHETVNIKQSHGGSGKQARAVLDGTEEADMVTLGLAYDVDSLYKKRKLIPENWQSLLPHNSSPYTSTVVFVVRKGNPQHIKDWDDLIKTDISVVTPDPKTSGGARWNYLAAWGYALKHHNNNEAAAQEFVSKLYKNTAVLNTGARGSTITFVERNIGDVLVTWENEAFLILHDYGAENYEIISPSLSILAEPPVAVVEDIARKHGTTELATEYLHYLYSEQGQEIVAKNYYRPVDAKIAKKYAAQFPKLELITINDFGGWDKAQEKHFSDEGVFDQIMGH